MSSASYRVPHAGPERESLRQKGQFWTPDWVAEAMVTYVLASGAKTLFDPAVGAGAFFLAARKLEDRLGRRIMLEGTDVDPGVLGDAKRNGLSEHDLAGVRIADFVLNPPETRFQAIVANPPYIRHHRLSSALKMSLRALALRTLGVALDGRAGLHVYFLVRALQLLEQEGRLAFIMPADTCEGVSAPQLWRWITSKYRLEAVVTFSSDASPFPGVDTNPIIFLIRNSAPQRHLLWAQCTAVCPDVLGEWMENCVVQASDPGLVAQERDVAEALATGLSRPPAAGANGGPVLHDFARVLRGIVTGANDFFFLRRAEAAALGIPADLLVSAIGRTRDVLNPEITRESMDALDATGRPTLLLSPDGRRLDDFPDRVREYLLRGEERGLPAKPLISLRRPWYKMEVRKPPAFLFAYLGRRNARFIRNRAGVVPLTTFLGVYPLTQDPEAIERLWQLLQHPQTVANLRLVGKSYGAGCIKVEPRALERLPLPPDVVSDLGLTSPVAGQLDLL